MAIDMKTATGGGVTLFVLSGSSSYLIANSVGDEEDATQRKSNGIVVAPKTKNELTPAEQFETLQETEEKIEIEEACSKAFEKPMNDENNKKEATASCANLTFEARAQQLNIDLLITKGQVNTTVLTNRFNSLKTKNLRTMASESIADIEWEDSKSNDENVKAFCESVKKLNLKKVLDSSWKQSLDEEWTNFLLACAKEADLTKDFWTGK